MYRPHGQFLSFEKYRLSKVRQIMVALRSKHVRGLQVTLSFASTEVSVWYAWSQRAVLPLTLIGFLVLVNCDCVDYSIVHKFSDRICNGRVSWSANPNTSTIWLFNLLCQLVELVEQQSCCQKLLKIKLLSKEKEQSLVPLIKKPSELRKPSTQL